MKVANSDLVVLVGVQYVDDDDYLAFAGSCSNRPIDFNFIDSIPNIGIIYINLKEIFKLNSDAILSTIVHELLHIIAFKKEFIELKEEDIFPDLINLKRIF